MSSSRLPSKQLSGGAKSESTIEPQDAEKKGTISLRGAVFIGIGSMVGAGIFALFGEAGTIAGAAVWLSFLIGGIIALLQGYSLSLLSYWS
jgi:amino acid transporter